MELRSGKNREFLADLDKDPGELKNLASDPAAQGTLKEHRQYLKEWSDKSGDKQAAKFLHQA